MTLRYFWRRLMVVATLLLCFWGSPILYAQDTPEIPPPLETVTPPQSGEVDLTEAEVDNPPTGGEAEPPPLEVTSPPVIEPEAAEDLTDSAPLQAPLVDPIPSSEDTVPGNRIDGFAVILDNQTLLVVRAPVGPFSAQERAEVITQRLQRLAQDDSIAIEDIRIQLEEDIYSIVYDSRTLLTITQADASTAKQEPQELASTYLNIIREAVQEYRDKRSLSHISRSLSIAFLSTLLLFLSLRLIIWFSPRSFRQLSQWGEERIPSFNIGQIRLMTSSQITDVIIGVLRFTRMLTVLSIIYLYLIFVFRLFPWTEHLGVSLTVPLQKQLDASLQLLADYLPSLGVLIIICIITYYTTKTIRFFFNEIKRGELLIPGFYQDWADPTCMLVLLGVMIIAIMIAVPYLPGFGTPAFQGISIFLGLLATLGSTATVANIVAGLILIYSRAFQVGDRVKIGDVTGDIVAKNILATKIRTIKNVYITIPNAAILGGSIIDFTTSCREYNTTLILNTTITLGYDIPWPKVYDALRKAAFATEDVLSDPSPFVFQTSLDDFYVSYELNVHITCPDRMAKVYSQLHENIQDKCNEAGIEILSPHYSALRDGNQITIPESYLPNTYIAPGFRVFPFGHSSTKE
ncbi:MAG: mechanosensitive ion channel [Synechococcaceae cyanobacterium SM2_3_1]|nr:mechanosensitive ion channel [Synechococcaceae cyanobacterium SM2_3_1]